MKSRICPCCSEEISYSLFYKGIIKIHKRNPWIEPEKGLICPYCHRQILSAERKTKLLIPMILVGMAPSWIYVFSLDIHYDLQEVFIILCLFGALIPISVLWIYRIFQKVDLICDDKNSDNYNQMTHG